MKSKENLFVKAKAFCPVVNHKFELLWDTGTESGWSKPNMHFYELLI